VRLLVLFNDPAYVAAHDVDEWARTEAALLIDRFGALAGAELTRLQSTGEYAHDHDWLLELRVTPDRDLGGVLGAPALREFVGDLRLLGTRPVVLVARDSIALTAPA
jgi:hypothetical protein